MKNMNTNRGLTLTSLLIGLLVVVVLISGILYLWQSSALAPGDGTATSTPAHPDWTTYNDPNGKFSFQYPKTFSSHVWTTRTPWPPTVKIFAATSTEAAIGAGCPEMSTLNPFDKTTGQTLSGARYDLYLQNDNGAGQRYDNYCYLIHKDGSYYTINIVVQSHTGCGNNQCGAYCGTPNEAECKAQDYAKDIEMPIKEVINSFSFVE